MRIFSIIIFTVSIFSQGFDWKMSFRLPYQIPELYLGGGLLAGTSSVSGNLVVDRNGDFCCDYKSGSGLNFGAYIQSDFWIRYDTKFKIALVYHTSNIGSNKTKSVPTSTGNFLDVKYLNSLTMNYLDFKIGGEYRLIKKLNLGINLNTGFLVSNKTELKLESGNTEFILGNSLVNLKSIFLSGEIIISYDIGMNEPNYITPYISFSRNLNSISSENDLNLVNINLGLTFQRGLRLRITD